MLGAAPAKKIAGSCVR